MGAGRYYFWGEPIYGYYRGDDYWVHLRNLQLLADAQVDFLIIDATNRITYPNQAETLMRAMSAIRQQGKPVPQVVFTRILLPARPCKQFMTSFMRHMRLRFAEKLVYIGRKAPDYRYFRGSKRPELRGLFHLQGVAVAQRAKEDRRLAVD